MRSWELILYHKDNTLSENKKKKKKKTRKLLRAAVHVLRVDRKIIQVS